MAEGIDASVFGGELTCLLGANGIGKSTLMRTLCGFQPKLAGKIFILGKEISDFSEKELARTLSVVLTEKTTVRNMTAYDLIGIGRSPYTGFWGTLDDTDKKVVDKAVELVKIEELSHRTVDTLSDGERQKVMIAKALAQQTEIILLDEPTAFLDFQSKVEIMQLLHRLTREAGKTIFMSTHDLELALQVADKIWLAGPSGHFETGTPEDLALDGKLGRFFTRKGIVFDEASGLFRLEAEHQKRIGLKGNPHKHAMIRKSLSRNGLLADTDETSDIYIYTGETAEAMMEVHYGNQTFSVENIEGLLTVIQSIDL